MTSRPILALGLGAALALVGCPGASSTPAPAAAPTASPAPSTPASGGAAVDGEKRYKATCSACHGLDGKGVPNLGKDLVASEWTRSQTDDQLLAFVKVGRGVDDPLNTTKVAMPPKGGNPALKDDEIKAIVAYIRTLQRAAKP